MATGFLFILGLCAAAWLAPRKYAAIPVLMAACWTPLELQLDLGGLNLYGYRLVLFVSLARLVASQRLFPPVFNRMDRLFLAWVIATIVFGTLREPSMEMLINRAGWAFNGFAVYFVVRGSIGSLENVVSNVRVLAVIILPVGLSMLTEHLTGRNILSALSGIHKSPLIRDGDFRAEGAFHNYILAGDFGAAMFPVFIGLAMASTGKRAISLCAAAACVVIVFSSSSGGPLLVLIAASIGIVLWAHRRHAQIIRRFGLAALVVLHLLMEAPVWYLMTKLGRVTGGTGWHRAYLIDQALLHFKEWAPTGTTYTAHWAPAGQVLASNPDMMDITNQFVAEGIQGGIVKLGLFVAMIVTGFSFVGRSSVPDRTQLFIPTEQRLIWSVGVALMAHCVAFFGVSYFDQIVAFWYWLLAIIAACIAEGEHREEERRALPVAPPGVPRSMMAQELLG